MADASRYQLAARAISRHTGRIELLSDHPDTVDNYILALEGAMSEHLVDVEQVRAFQATEMPRVEKTIATPRAKADANKVLNAPQRREVQNGRAAGRERECT